MESVSLEIILALVGVLGGAGAWNFYSKRLELKHKETDSERREQNLFRDEIFTELKRVKEELAISNEKVLALTGEVSTLRERVKNLEAENDRLLRK